MNSESMAAVAATVARWPRKYWWAIVVAVSAVTALELWSFRRILFDYFPALDEIAIQGASTPIGGPIDPLSWLTRGFNGYFLPYPEWQSAVGDSWRPLVNLYYWASYLVFGTVWSSQLIVGYLAHAAVVALVAVLSAGVLRLRIWPTAAAVAIALLNPGLVHLDSLRDPFLIPRAIQFPNYQVEILATLLVILSLFALLRGRFAWFCLWASLAVLLRETAVIFPACALALSVKWHSAEPGRNWKYLAWVGAPLAVWLIGITCMSLHAQYAFAPHPIGLLSQLPRRLMFWPTGLFQASLFDLKAAATRRDLSTLALYGGELSANMTWWLALLAAAIYYGRNRRQAAAPAVQSGPHPGALALLFATGSLMLFTVLPPDIRLGYLWFALAPAPIFYALMQLRAGAVYVAVLAMSLVVPQIHSLTIALSSPSVQAYGVARRSARQLAELLGSLAANVNTAFLVDDMVVQTSSPEYFAKLSTFHGRLVLINNIAPVVGCRPSSAPVQQYQLFDHGEGETWLTYQAAECYASPWSVPALALLDQHNVIRRGDNLSYAYPDISTGERSAAKPYEPGRRFTVRSKDYACATAGACVWIGFNPATQRYYVLPIESLAAAQ